jgi:alginate O-acetyltransferase complex protein AlgI
MTRRLAKLMGFELAVNFRAPYLVSIPEAFWCHRHINLSTWLRDSLSPFRCGATVMEDGRLTTTSCSRCRGGLLHDASVAFVLWGVFHGLLLAVYRFWLEFYGLPSAEDRQGIL